MLHKTASALSRLVDLYRRDSYIVAGKSSAVTGASVNFNAKLAGVGWRGSRSCMKMRPTVLRHRARRIHSQDHPLLHVFCSRFCPTTFHSRSLDPSIKCTVTHLPCLGNNDEEAGGRNAASDFNGAVRAARCVLTEIWKATNFQEPKRCPDSHLCGDQSSGLK